MSLNTVAYHSLSTSSPCKLNSDKNQTTFTSQLQSKAVFGHEFFELIFNYIFKLKIVCSGHLSLECFSSGATLLKRYFQILEEVGALPSEKPQI